MRKVCKSYPWSHGLYFFPIRQSFTISNMPPSRASTFTRINGNVSCICDKRLQNLHIV